MGSPDFNKSSVILVKCDDVLDALKITLNGLKGEPKILLHHISFEQWVRETCVESSEETHLFPFTSNEMFDLVPISSSQYNEVVFLDFDIFTNVHGIHTALQTLVKLKKNKRVYIACSTEDPYNQVFEKVADGVLKLQKTSDKHIFKATNTILDKKGTIHTSEKLISLQTTGKSIFKPTSTTTTRDVKETLIDDTPNIERLKENTEKSIDLPFFVSRTEDGVAIRDAAQRKIRVGGQIIYEPDREDDFDDSDPDDDLNI